MDPSNPFNPSNQEAETGGFLFEATIVYIAKTKIQYPKIKKKKVKKAP